MRQPTLFEAERLDLLGSIDLTIQSLREYGARHRHWAIAYSGGKDSTTVLSLVVHLIKTGRIPRPERLSVLYADTRMELPPLASAAKEMLALLAAEGFETRVALAPLDDRFFVYMLGRGIPPPNNRTFRWCTGQLKVEPMVAELGRLGTAGKVLMLTGVRLGESAVRDQRIAIGCSKDGSECGQGWYQETLPDQLCDTLAPILHWRTCLVWDWLCELLPAEYRHGYPTRLVADAYGLHEEGSDGEIGARTGCVGCPLANRDSAIDNLLRFSRWAWLAPLKELRPLYRWLREPAQRLRMPGGEARKDGSLSRNQNRMGPLTMEARRIALARVLEVQAECNRLRPAGTDAVDILNAEEVARIEDLIAAGTWPQKWTGEEPTGDLPYEGWDASGTVQGLLYREKT